MRKANKIIKSFALEPEVHAYIVHTRAGHSASERANELLKRAIAGEEQERLATEAQAFFREMGAADSEESRAFQAATLRALARDGD